MAESLTPTWNTNGSLAASVTASTGQLVRRARAWARPLKEAFTQRGALDAATERILELELEQEALFQECAELEAAWSRAQIEARALEHRCAALEERLAHSTPNPVVEAIERRAQARVERIRVDLERSEAAREQGARREKELCQALADRDRHLRELEKQVGALERRESVFKEVLGQFDRMREAVEGLSNPSNGQALAAGTQLLNLLEEGKDTAPAIQVVDTSSPGKTLVLKPTVMPAEPPPSAAIERLTERLETALRAQEEAARRLEDALVGASSKAPPVTSADLLDQMKQGMAQLFTQHPAALGAGSEMGEATARWAAPPPPDPQLHEEQLNHRLRSLLREELKKTPPAGLAVLTSRVEQVVDLVERWQQDTPSNGAIRGPAQQGIMHGRKQRSPDAMKQRRGVLAKLLQDNLEFQRDLLGDKPAG